MFFLNNCFFLYFSKEFCRVADVFSSLQHLPYQHFPINCSPSCYHHSLLTCSSVINGQPRIWWRVAGPDRWRKKQTGPLRLRLCDQYQTVNNQQRRHRLGSSIVNGSVHQTTHDLTDRPWTWSTTTTRNTWKNPMSWKRFALHMGYTVSHSGSIRRHRSVGARGDQYRQRQQLGVLSK